MKWNEKVKINLTILLLGILLMGFSNCESSKPRNNSIQLEQAPPFTIGDSYSQDWIAGIAGGGSGTNLYISFKEFSEDIVVQDFFFRNKNVRAQVSNTNGNEYIGFFKNETNKKVIMDRDPIKESQNTPPKKLPFQLKEHEAVISYLHDGDLQYFKISNIEEKPLIAYPTTNNKNDQE